jgi:uncharacterized protein YndB with AHSA1/START domain
MMSSRNGKPRYDYQIHINASPDEVWRALSDGDMTRHYAFGTRFEGSLTKGAPYAFLTDEAVKCVHGEILDVKLNERLVMSWSAHWDAAVDKDPPSRVTYDLESTSPNTTCLRLTHDQFDGETATYASSVSSWPLMLSSLKTLVESGKALPMS